MSHSSEADITDQAKRPSSPYAKEAGFTLVELLVVMSILVLLASIVAPRVLGYLGQSRTKAARIQIENIITSLDLYKLDTGRFPGNADGLLALAKSVSRQRGWNGPYIRGSRDPVDPWGHPYRYRIPGQFGEYDLYSLGADNQPGGSDENTDITSW